MFSAITLKKGLVVVNKETPMIFADFVEPAVSDDGGLFVVVPLTGDVDWLQPMLIVSKATISHVHALRFMVHSVGWLVRGLVTKER